MSFLTRSTATLAVLISMTVLVPAPAAAAPAGDDLAPVMLVLDASGSMRETLPGGGTRMAAAKAAVTTLLTAAPAEARLGLAVYGTATGNTAAEKAKGCQDVTVVQPVRPLDRAGLTAAVDGVQPRGYTPIGQALRTAADQLPAEGPRSIVLVSDGVDTCTPPDPCEVARELAAKGVDLRIHAVGFAVDATAREQLTCLTGATGGTYVDAVDAASLTGALTRVTRQALRAYDAAGAPISGTTDPPGAPALGPGAYLDRIGPDEDRFYTVDVPAGWTLYATASAILATGGDYLVLVSRYDADRRADCSGRAQGVKTEGPVGSAALRWTAAADGADACGRPGKQVIRVQLDAVSAGDPPSELELLIGLEPPAGDSGAAGNADPATFTSPRGDARAVTGGGSFSTATALDGSGAYTDAVVPGEMVFYRVRLDWGQGLAYRLTLPAGPATSAFVKTAWYTPARDEVDVESAAYGGKALTVKTLAGPPVRYRNRELPSTEPGAAASVAGWYYISVFADAPVSASPVPVTLELTVTGDTGAAPYAESPFGADAPKTAPKTAADAAAGSPLWIWIIAAVALLILLATAAVIIVVYARFRRTG